MVVEVVGDERREEKCCPSLQSRHISLGGHSSPSSLPAHQQMESEAKSRHSQGVRRKNSGNEGTARAPTTQRRQSEEEEHQVSVNSHRNEENIPHSTKV